jgi:hypothetical protein
MATHTWAHWQAESTQLLHRLTGGHGIRASLSQEGNYAAVFARDAVMAGLLGLVLGDTHLTKGLLATLRHLEALQGTEGQIVSNYYISDSGVTKISYGTLSPKLDSATWFLVGVACSIRAGHCGPETWRQSVRKTCALLDALEYNGRHLVYVPQGGNWADEYPYEGYLLYDQVLRCWALRLLGVVYNEKDYINKSESILESIFINYFPSADEGALAYHARLHQGAVERKLPHFYAGFAPTAYNETFDLAAHALVGIVATGHPRTLSALRWIDDAFLAKGILPPAFSPVIKEGDIGWERISNYYIYVFKNKPYHYHNGGVWWIWLGWLAAALRLNGQWAALQRLYRLSQDELESTSSFDFEEYLIGQGANEMGGTKKMAYTATGLLLLENAATAVSFSSFKNTMTC